MQSLFKTLVCLLLIAVITAPLGAQGLRPDGPGHDRPTGCHEDGGNVPTPAPTSHNCCQNGHHPAILQQSSGSRPSLYISAQVESSVSAIIVAPGLFQNFSVVFVGPSVMSPL